MKYAALLLMLCSCAGTFGDEPFECPSPSTVLDRAACAADPNCRALGFPELAFVYDLANPDPCSRCAWPKIETTDLRPALTSSWPGGCSYTYETAQECEIEGASCKRVVDVEFRGGVDEPS